MSRTSLTTKLALAWGLAAFVACAANTQRASAPSAMPSASPAGPGTDDPRAEIERLSAQIDSARAQQPHGEGSVSAMSSVTPSAPTAPNGRIQTSHDDPTCHPAVTPTCDDSCRIADTICDNAGKICKLADQLANDTWAANKCSTAKDTCSTSHTTCCGCQ